MTTANPITPYAGTSGWTGTTTSQQRAINNDSDGTTTRIQQRILASVTNAGPHGATWKELAETHNLHHGTVSGALSVLHKTGHIARLTITRQRCKIYIAPEHVGHHETEQQASRRTVAKLKTDIELLINNRIKTTHNTHIKAELTHLQTLIKNL